MQIVDHVSRNAMLRVVVDGAALRRLSREDGAIVQAIFETDPGYFERIERAPLRADEGFQIFDERPDSVPPQRKHVFVADGAAVLDVLEGYPEPHIWYLGLIFVAPALRGRGFGTRLVEALCETVRVAGGSALRLAVMHDNADARRLYDRMGFAFVVERVRQSWNGERAPCDVLQRHL